MARILLVDNESGDRARAPRARSGSASRSSNRWSRSPRRWCAPPRPVTRSSSCRPPSLEASFASRPSSSGDVLRETFDVFEDGVCLLARDGSLKVANAIGERLFSSVLKADLQSVASDATQRRAIADRSLSLDGRAFVVRAYPLSERGVVLYVRDATDEREREIGRLQSEKLASIGMLAAGVAHEINNPAAFVLANIEALTGHMRLIEDKLRELPDLDAARAALSNLLFEASAILQESKEGMARIQRIVRDLGSFSHADEDVSVPISVNTAVESALTMLRNELKYRARVEQDLRATRLVLASAPRLGQVFLNLISNAVQALEEADVKRNLVRVRSFDEGDHVVVEVIGQRARHRARSGAAHLRVVLHDQAARDGHRARPADLARHRAQPGRRDHRREPAGAGGDVPGADPRHGGGAAAAAVGARRRRRHASSRGAASSRSTTRRCCSRPTAACSATRTSSSPPWAARRRWPCCRRTRASTSCCATCRCPRCRGWSCTPRSRSAIPALAESVRVRDGRRVLRRRAAVPRGVGARGHPEAVQRRRPAGAGRHHRVREGQRVPTPALVAAPAVEAAPAVI